MKISILTNKCLNDTAPQYSNNMINTQTKILRSQTKQLLQVTAIKSKTLGNRSFYFVAPKICNALPVNLRSSK